MDTTLVPFPTTKNISRAKISRIAQIDFSIHRHKNLDLIEIWSLNNLVPRNDDNPYKWRIMPSAYTIYLNRAFFRLETLKHAVQHTMQHTTGEQRLIVPLKQQLLHLDITLDQVWEEAREADANDRMNGSWRSKTLDEWLVIEFHLQRHNTFDIDTFIDEDAGNKEKLKMDPFDLDWDDFDTSQPQWLGGSEYKWDISVMRRKCPMETVAEYYLAFFGLDDQAAAAIIHKAFNKDTIDKGSASKQDKRKSQRKLVAEKEKVKVEKVDDSKGKGKGKGKGKVEKNTKTKVKGKSKKSGDDGDMDVDVESEDDGSDKDAEGELVDDEDFANVKRKPHEPTTFRPKPLPKAPAMATRASKRLKLEQTPSTTSSTSRTNSSDAQDLGALLVVKALSSSTSEVSPISAVHSSTATSPAIIDDPQINLRVAQDNNEGESLDIKASHLDIHQGHNDDSLGVRVPDAETVLAETDKSFGIKVPDAQTVVVAKNDYNEDNMLEVKVPDADTFMAQNAFASDLATCYTTKT